MQVIRYALEQIADEMGYTLVRTARSPIIKEIMDITCAVFDDKGQTTAQAHHAPMLLTGFELTMKELVKYFDPADLNEGDVIISNDPYMGGQHIMDVQTFAPVHYKKELVGLVGSIGHQSDMGGAAPGGVAGGMTEIYQEGLRIPMVKLYKNFEENRDIFNIVRNNIRVPDNTIGDIKAQAASNYVGVRKIQGIYEKYGVDIVHKCIDMLLDYSEKRMRAGISALPDGKYSGTAYIDNDGIKDEPIPITVNINIKGDAAKVDFKGTSKQVQGNTNCPISTTHAAVFYTIISVADPAVPPNSGCYRPVSITADEGLIVNPRIPGAVAARTNCSQKIVEAMLKALAKAAPDKVMAGSHGQISTCGFSGYQQGKRWVYTDIQGGGAGALPRKDGKDGQDSHLARFMNTPIEAIELEYPVRIEEYGFINDSGGAGKYRGALALRRDIRFLVDKVSFARYGDSQEIAPFGLFGGKEGSRGRFILNPETSSEQRLKSKGISSLQLNDVVSLRLPGGGGYGKPTERNIEAVKLDFQNGKVSEKSLTKLYGVAVTRRGKNIEFKRTPSKGKKLKK
jgi:N-methylhydantoinase B